MCFVQDKRKYLNNGYNRCNIGLNHLAFRCQTKDKLIKLGSILFREI